MTALAEVLAAGDDLVVECVCGERWRGYDGRTEAEEARDRHNTEHEEATMEI